jgi:hypothetical protein
MSTSNIADQDKKLNEVYYTLAIYNVYNSVYNTTSNYINETFAALDEAIATGNTSEDAYNILEVAVSTGYANGYAGYDRYVAAAAAAYEANDQAYKDVSLAVVNLKAAYNTLIANISTTEHELSSKRRFGH